MRGVVRRVRAGAAERELARLGFGHLDEIRVRLDRALVVNDDRVRRVVKPVDGRDVFRLVLHLTFERLEHDVRQIDADDVEAVAGQLIHLRPHEAAARAGLVLHDRLDLRTPLLEHRLLVPCRDIRFASRRESLPILDVLLGARLGRGMTEHQRTAQCGRCGDEEIFLHDRPSDELESERVKRTRTRLQDVNASSVSCVLGRRPLGIVIPLVVRRYFATRETLRELPRVTASGTRCARPERIPQGAASRHARPSVFRARPPLAFGTVDFRLVHAVLRCGPSHPRSKSAITVSITARGRLRLRLNRST